MLARFYLLVGFFILSGFSTTLTWAAVSRPQMETPSRILKSAGVVAGGQAGSNLSLMDFRRSYSAKNRLERLVLDFGKGDLSPAEGLIGYYHAELQDEPPRLVLELPQTLGTKIDEKEIRRRLRDSAYVRNVLLDFDRMQQSMSLVFQLREPVQLRVTPVRRRGSAGKIVLDFTPVAKSPSTPHAKASEAGKTVKR